MAKILLDRYSCHLKEKGGIFQFQHDIDHFKTKLGKLSTFVI